MLPHPLGPRTQHIYTALHERIRSGQLVAGDQLPPHRRLAIEFGVAPMTIRQVLARMEEDGLVSRQVGRGTFVRAPAGPSVLILARKRVRDALVEHVDSAGQVALSVSRPDDALRVLAGDRGIGLVLVEIGPGVGGVEHREFVRSARQRWPELRLAVLIASAADLEELWETGERPLLVLSTPPRPADVLDVVRLALPSRAERVPAVRATAPAAATLGGLGSLVDTAGLETLKFQARLLDSVAEAVIATGPRGDILYWNKAAERLYGWRADEVIGRNAGQVIVAPDQYEQGTRIMERLRRGETWSGEFATRRRDGTPLDVLVTDSPIRDADGKLVGIIGVSMDISERKQAESDRLAVAQLEAALMAIQVAEQQLSQQLTLNVPRFGRLASDPELPAHLRPIAGLVLQALRDVADHLEHPRNLAH